MLRCHTMRLVRHLLIVEDSERLASTLREVFLARAVKISLAGGLAAARDILSREQPDAIILDVALPDGDGASLLPDIRALESLPHVIAISGAATPVEAFRLAQGGVRAFLPKPLDLAQLEALWSETIASPPGLNAALRASVGGMALHTLEDLVRDTVVDEALARANGSIRGASKLLHISRQLLQQILRKRSNGNT